MNSHITGTWLLANLFHPVILILYSFDGFLYLDSEEVPMALLFFFICFMLSLPSLFLGFLAGYLISLLPGTGSLKLIVWIIVAPCIVLLNWIFLALLFVKGNFHLFETGIVVPAMLSATMAAICRSNYFLNAINTAGQPKKRKISNLF